MNYRPSGWQNPYVGEVMKEIAYEDMADSIIEQIKKDGIHVFLPPGYVYDSHAIRMFCESLAQKSGARGWIIWIPDLKTSALNGFDQKDIHFNGGGELI